MIRSSADKCQIGVTRVERLQTFGKLTVSVCESSIVLFKESIDLTIRNERFVYPPEGNMLTSSITPSSSTPLSSSSSSSSSFASSIANGVRSIYAAAFAAACSMLGIGEYSAGESFDLGVGVSTVRSEEDVDVDGVAIVVGLSGT